MLISVVLLSQVPLYGSFREAFRNVHTVLVDKFDVSHGLIDALYRNGVLASAHVNDIRVSTLFTLLTLEISGGNVFFSIPFPPISNGLFLFPFAFPGSARFYSRCLQLFPAAASPILHCISTKFSPLKSSYNFVKS